MYEAVWNSSLHLLCIISIFLHRLLGTVRPAPIGKRDFLFRGMRRFHFSALDVSDSLRPLDALRQVSPAARAALAHPLESFSAQQLVNGIDKIKKSAGLRKAKSDEMIHF